MKSSNNECLEERRKAWNQSTFNTGMPPEAAAHSKERESPQNMHMHAPSNSHFPLTRPQIPPLGQLSPYCRSTHHAQILPNLEKSFVLSLNGEGCEHQQACMLFLQNAKPCSPKLCQAHKIFQTPELMIVM